MQLGEINDGLGQLLVSGLPFPVKALCATTETVVVLFQPDAFVEQYGQFENLRAYDYRGEEIWRGDLPTTHTGDHFGSMSCSGVHVVVAHSFSGFRLTLELRTGKETERTFLK